MLFQQVPQLLHQVFLGRQRQQRHAQSLGQPLPARAARLGQLAIGLAQLVGVGVQLEVGGAFAEAQQSGGGEGMVERVGQR